METSLFGEIDDQKFLPEVETIEIYHDEVKDGKNRPFGHQILIVPTRTKETFNSMLLAIRDEYKIPKQDHRTIKWNKLSQRDDRIKKLAKGWLEVLNTGMYLKPCPVQTIEGIKRPDRPVGVRTASIFIDSINDLSDEFWYHESTGELKTLKFETLLRMVIKGALHYCFNPEFTEYEKVVLDGFYTDNWPYHIKMNRGRLIDRLRYETRDYVEISDDFRFGAIEKSKEKSEDINFLELTDLTLGSTRYLCGESSDPWRQKIVSPLEEVYRKQERGRSFENSGHYRSFTVTYADLDEDAEEWSFERWDTNEFDNPSQPGLFKNTIA